MRCFGKAVQCRIDIVAPRASQRRHRAVADCARHRAHTLQISARSDGESGLNNVHAKRFELPGHAYFFRHTHRKPGRLLSIPQRGIKNMYDVHSLRHTPTLSIPTYTKSRVKFIILVSAINHYYTSGYLK